MPDSELTRGPVTNADGHPAAEDLAGSDVAAVELRDVSKRYSAQHAPAVEHVDISIRNGEFFSLLGPSGSGKTTTLRMIAGLELPSAGTIWLQGLDVSNVPAYRRNVNTVFQSYALFPHMRVHENIAYPLKMRKLNRREITRRVAEILDRVGLTGLEQRRPLELSGGQRQRVALARALIGQPAVLLLDEPLGALDLKLREAMLVLLKRLQRDFGITFVYVTHDQVEALAMSDRVAVMNAGRVEQIAPPLELYARPQSAFVAAFIGKTNLLQCVRARGNTVTWHGLKLNVEQLPDPGATEFTLSLRPEAIELGTASRAQANHFSGTVTEVLFLGHEHELRVDVGGGTLIARCGPGSVYARGDTLELGWPSEAAVALEATP